ncbi:golgi familyn subfamily A member 7 [Wallemia ichthyophaga EXF-994]|uniref:Ras modification protein ERF4 n=1 Tax=Wallemia ichthyophaga (strain EXF-994 / CBS 113033) TaxID=1299270 RepID=R9ACX3_WALI9|nr:golgi familyn subfamily A member 7 [Wallemia ichthyophaga EXF-994]EOQ99944.1 golgi familyn subfamily A member 7 [Wallemia ichthyophaga EXF-994]
MDNSSKQASNFNSSHTSSHSSHSNHSNHSNHSTHSNPPINLKNFGTPQSHRILIDLPRELIRLDRDYRAGEVWQFKSTFPMELEGRIGVDEFKIAVDHINNILLQAFNPWMAVLDHLLDTLSLYTLSWFKQSHFQKHISSLEKSLNHINYSSFNPAGLNILNPQSIAFLYLEIEFY